MLLADGAPSPNIYRDEVLYLERALETEPRVATEVRDASAGGLGALTDFDVVVLANVAALSAADRRALTRFVEDGGGLLVTTGDRVEPAALERQLGRLLPARPRAVVTRRPGEPAFAFAPSLSPHPVTLPFDSSLAVQGLTSARIWRRLTVEPDAADGDGAAQVLLRFGDQQPALLERAYGAGRVALYATTVDRDWNDLPVKPGFVPLTARLVLYLGRGLTVPRPHHYTVGDEVVLASDRSAAEPPRFEAPDGSWLEPQPADTGFVIDRVEVPGPYRAFHRDRRSPGDDFVVNLAPNESDFRRADADALRALVGAGVELGDDGERTARREDEAVLPLLLIAAAAFLAESWLGRRRAPTLVGAES